MCALAGDLTIDLRALAQNYSYLDDLSAATCETGAAVKANAYGLGVSRVARALYSVGARRFFVAHFDEAMELRGVVPDAYIYVLGGFAARYADEYVRNALTPVLNSLPEIAEYQGYTRRVGRALPAILHFDSGMNRLGLSRLEVQALRDDLSLLDGVNLDYVMSHFASADEMDNTFTQKQCDRFLRDTDFLNTVQKSICNSAGLFHGADYHFDLSRPGIALYGGKPNDAPAGNPMQPVVRLKAPVLQIRDAQKGDVCGYNETYSFGEKSKLAIVSAGYADGLFRALSNASSFYYKSHELPVRGRVSMDLVICDLCNIPECEYPQRGDFVEIIGAHQTVDDLAKAAGTIAYEVLTSLGARYKRSYIE